MLKRLTQRLRSSSPADTEAELRTLAARIDAQHVLLGEVRDAIAQMPSRSELDAHRERTVEILRLIYADEPELRRRLARRRRTPEYAAAFEEAEPLVSVIIPTWDNYSLLAERSLPSVLAQSYVRFEIIVVGDAAPAEAAAVVAAVGDPRISYANLTHRSLYPTDPRQMWRVGGVPAANEALARANGRWIAMLNDDDAFRPDHLERLLALARRDRLELAYGKLLCHMPSGATVEVGAFPPRYGQFGLQGAIFHAELADFGFELADALFELPGDWGLTQRMLRAGARVGMLAEVVTDYFPASEFTPRAGSEHPDMTDMVG